MYYNNKKVTRVYTSSHSKNTYATISGISGWKKVNGLSVDGTTNVYLTLVEALANNRFVNVYIASNKIERIVMR